MPDLALASVTKTYKANLPRASKPKATLRAAAAQQALLGATTTAAQKAAATGRIPAAAPTITPTAEVNPNLPVAVQMHEQAKREAQKAEVARMSLALRAMATAADRLRAIPGGGPAADGILATLDAMINKGGRLYVNETTGRLVRQSPPPQVGWAWLLSVAPWAMRGISAAATAAKVGLARFGPGLIRNARTAMGFVTTKVGGLLAKAAKLPGVSSVVGLAKRALGIAGTALGISSLVSAVTPEGRKKAREGAGRAWEQAKQGNYIEAVKEAAAAPFEGAAASAPSVAKAIVPTWVWWAGGGLLAVKLLS